LRRDNRALDQEPPVRLLDTDVAARQVEDLRVRPADVEGQERYFADAS
jgi:hypothetical protein